MLLGQNKALKSTYGMSSGRGVEVAAAFDGHRSVLKRVFMTLA